MSIAVSNELKSLTKFSGWMQIAAIVAVALSLRLAFYNGVMGSDDLTYFSRALEIANGVWTSSDYVGSIRYAFNLPVGLALAIGGPSTWVANIWPVVCSMAEVAMVAALARDLGGRRAGWIAGLLLASTSLHIAVATRIHTDPIVSFFLTGGFVGIWFGLRRANIGALVFAGASFGAVYWTKEAAVITYVAALPMLAYFRRRWSMFAWVLGGALAAIALNALLMWHISGDPLHPARLIFSFVSTRFAGGFGNDAPNYYVPYLFADLRHVGLLGWLAALGVLGVTADRLRVRRARPPAEAAVGRPEAGYVVVWLLGLLLVLSLFPVSLHPLRFTMKQSNYITLFLAPLALTATLGVLRLPRPVVVPATALAVAIGAGLGALQQADLRAFTANGKALWVYLRERPDVLAVASTGNYRVVSMLAKEHPQGTTPAVWVSSDPALASGRTVTLPPDIVRIVAVIDPQTIGWVDRGVDRPMSCWREETTLTPVGLDVGNRVAGWLLALAKSLPGWLGAAAQSKLTPLAEPRPSMVYSVPATDFWCAGAGTAASR